MDGFKGKHGEIIYKLMVFMEHLYTNIVFFFCGTQIQVLI